MKPRLTSAPLTLEDFHIRARVCARLRIPNGGFFYTFIEQRDADLMWLAQLMCLEPAILRADPAGRQPAFKPCGQMIDVRAARAFRWALL